MRSLIIGASAGLGRELAESLARRGHDLFLVASDARDLAPLASDLSLRHGVRVHYAAEDLVGLQAAQLRDRVLSGLGSPDCIAYVAGASDRRDTGSVSEHLLSRLVEVNYVAAVKIINAFLDDLATSRHSNIIGIGAVAAARGRRRNSIYAASKRGLEFYFEALRIQGRIANPCNLYCCSSCNDSIHKRFTNVSDRGNIRGRIRFRRDQRQFYTRRERRTIASTNFSNKYTNLAAPDVTLDRS